MCFANLLPSLSPQRLAKEIRVWTMLKNENVLPLLGYFTVGKNKMPSMISEWMEDGTMTKYMKTFDRCSIETLRMVSCRIVFHKNINQQSFS